MSINICQQGWCYIINWGRHRVPSSSWWPHSPKPKNSQWQQSLFDISDFFRAHVQNDFMCVKSNPMWCLIIPEMKVFLVLSTYHSFILPTYHSFVLSTYHSFVLSTYHSFSQHNCSDHWNIYTWMDINKSSIP